MQFIPSAWKDFWNWNRTNPENNIKAGCKYFSELLKKFNWNYSIAATAFNTWPTRMRRVMKANNITKSDIAKAWPDDTKLLAKMIYWPRVKWFWKDWKQYYKKITYYKRKLHN